MMTLIQPSDQSHRPLVWLGREEEVRDEEGEARRSGGQGVKEARGHHDEKEELCAKCNEAKEEKLLKRSSISLEMQTQED